jgi:hypothetical protein
MKRRNFLKFLGLGATVAAVPGISFAYYDFNKSLIGILKNDLHYLTLDEEGVEKFVVDFEKECSDADKLKIRMLYMTAYTSENFYIVEKISRHFLLGSDFFRNKMDESKVVHYTAPYSPYTTPCGNPFNSLNYPENA